MSESLEDPSFKLKGIHIANLILEYMYLGLIVMCYILALGNRPQGAKWGYTLAFIGFALITVYMTVRLSKPLNVSFKLNVFVKRFHDRLPRSSSRSRVSRILRRRKGRYPPIPSSQTLYSGTSSFRSWPRSGCTSPPRSYSCVIVHL